MKTVYTIENLDLEDKAVNIIGVASTVENAKRMIDEYYGFILHKGTDQEPKRSVYRDIRSSGIEFQETISVPNPLGGEYVVTVRYFELDEKL